MWVHSITVGKPVRRVIADNRYPLVIHKKTFQLNYEHDHFTIFQFKTNAQGIFIVQQAAEFNASHVVIVQQGEHSFTAGDDC